MGELLSHDDGDDKSSAAPVLVTALSSEDGNLTCSAELNLLLKCCAERIFAFCAAAAAAIS